VLQAVERLDYRPNRAARTLATSRSRTIGVVATDYRSYGPSTMLWSVEEAARDAGYEVAVLSLRETDDATVRQALDRLASQAVEGIVYIAPQDPALHAAFLNIRDVPVVTYVGFETERPHPVVFDSMAGSRLATEYLVGLGHRRIGHIAGHPGFAVSASRIEGWRRALADADLPARAQVDGDWSAEGGYRAAEELLERFPETTAVHVANDHMALGAMLAAHRAGRRVPEDLSVVGFDDVPEARFFAPPLTTVRQDFGALGRRCIEALLAEMGRGESVAFEPVVPELVLRESSAPPG